MSHRHGAALRIRVQCARHPVWGRAHLPILGDPNRAQPVPLGKAGPHLAELAVAYGYDGVARVEQVDDGAFHGCPAGGVDREDVAGGGAEERP